MTGCWSFHFDSISDGSMQNKLICVMPNRTTSKVLQLEARPGDREDRFLHPKLVDHQVLYQSSMVPVSSVSVIGKMTDGEDSGNHPTVEFPATVSNLPGPVGGLLMPSSSENRYGNPPNRSETYHEVGSPGASCLAHHKEFLQRLQTSSYPFGELRPKVKL